MTYLSSFLEELMLSHALKLWGSKEPKAGKRLITCSSCQTGGTDRACQAGFVPNRWRRSSLLGKLFDRLRQNLRCGKQAELFRRNPLNPKPINRKPLNPTPYLLPRPLGRQVLVCGHRCRSRSREGFLKRFRWAHTRRSSPLNPKP